MKYSVEGCFFDVTVVGGEKSNGLDMQIISNPSPNFDSRNGASITMLVLHYTGMMTGHGALARLCDPEAKVSSHYLIEEDGRIFQLVEESERAWHAGVSCWRGERAVNAHSIGIEIVNPGHEYGYRPFPELQMQSVVALSNTILERYPISANNVIGHSDVAFQRKEDPGELFDWQGLAAQGIGLWHDNPQVQGDLWLRMGDKGEQVIQMQVALADYGYDITATGEFDILTEQCVVAFQRHFRPNHLDGMWDDECAAMLDILLKKR